MSRTFRTALLLIIVIAAGVASRRYAFMLPIVIRKRTGDALWAAAAFLALRGLRPAWTTARVTAVSLVVTSAIEFSQRSHAPWLEAIRAHVVGRLLIGVGFYWLDLVAYAAGIAAVVPVDAAWLRTPPPRRPGGGGDESPQSACDPLFPN